MVLSINVQGVHKRRNLVTSRVLRSSEPILAGLHPDKNTSLFSGVKYFNSVSRIWGQNIMEIKVAEINASHN